MNEYFDIVSKKKKRPVSDLFNKLREQYDAETKSCLKTCENVFQPVITEIGSTRDSTSLLSGHPLHVLGPLWHYCTNSSEYN